MTITKDDAFTVMDDLRGFNLMNLPLETLHHVLSFVSMKNIFKFAFVCRQAFVVAKALKWVNLDFSSLRNCWPKDVAYLSDRAQATCQRLALPTTCGYLKLSN